ncbi:uncharacterized protein [Palaemon carinicauda]|uniref:uncharacterized protein n=1 Tax=Palaemon carinicauda TaxID=392227 RepID=UPI0035B65E9A
MPFNLQQFIVSPRDHVESLTVATKTDLKNLARHYDVQVPATAVKCVILSHILNFLVDEDIVPEEELADVRALTVTNPNGDLDKLSLQLELEKMKMQAATAAAEVEERKAAAAERAATAATLVERERAAAAERAATAAAELEERKAAAAERKAAAAASLERIKVETALEQQEKASEQKNNALRVRLQIEREAATVTERDLAFIRLKEKEEGKLIPEPFDVGKVQKLLPTFEEREPDNYFSVFEDTAKNLNWPQDKWYLIIRNSFKGKALSVCVTMLEEHDYFIIKQAILDAYSITAEGYRQIFRNSQKQVQETFLEFMNGKIKQFQKWVDKVDVKTFEQLKDLIVMEEFLRKIPGSINVYLREQNESDPKKAALKADDYALIHK